MMIHYYYRLYKKTGSSIYKQIFQNIMRHARMSGTVWHEEIDFDDPDTIEVFLKNFHKRKYRRLEYHNRFGRPIFTFSHERDL